MVVDMFIDFIVKSHFLVCEGEDVVLLQGEVECHIFFWRHATLLHDFYLLMGFWPGW